MSAYDAYVGPLQEYTTVAAALNAGKSSIRVVGNTLETDSWNVPSGETSIIINPNATVVYTGTNPFIISEQFIPTFFFTVYGGTLDYQSSALVTNTTTFPGSLVKLDYITINSTSKTIGVSSENIIINECSMNVNAFDVTDSVNILMTGNTFVGNVTSSSANNILTMQSNIVYGSIIVDNNPQLIRLESNRIGFLNIYDSIDNINIMNNVINYAISTTTTSITNSIISANMITHWNLNANFDLCTISSNSIESNVYLHDVSNTYITDNIMGELYIGSDAHDIPSITETTITGNTVTLIYVNSGINTSNVLNNNTAASIIFEGEVIDLTATNNVCDLIQLRSTVSESHLENNNTNNITILGLMEKTVITEEKDSVITLKDVNNSSIKDNFNCTFYCGFFKRSSFSMNYGTINIDKSKYAQIVHNNGSIVVNCANRSIIQSNIGKLNVKSAKKSIINSNIRTGCKGQ